MNALFKDGHLLSEHVERCRERFIQDALAEATSAYWYRRAQDFDAVGTRECDEVAMACRNAARIALFRTPDYVTCPTCKTPTSPWPCSCGETRLEVYAA